MENAYNKSVKEVLAHFKVSESDGLYQHQVNASRTKYGRNGMNTLFLTEE
jgi:hypothetical protein